MKKPKPYVLLEHPDFYIVHKPALWLTHPAHYRSDISVPDVISFMQAETGESQLAPPHRLDRETSGTQIISRDLDSAKVFFTLFKNHMVGKTYLAIVRGVPEWQEISLDAPLGDLGIGGANKVIVRQAVVPNGKPAKTDFRHLESRGGCSLVQALPQSGRMHQVRAHLFHLGLPMLGDKIYGTDPSAYLDFIKTGQTPELTSRLGLARQALHASRIAFPWAGGHVAAESPLAADLLECWDGLV